MNLSYFGTHAPHLKDDADDARSETHFDLFIAALVIIMLVALAGLFGVLYTLTSAVIR